MRAFRWRAVGACAAVLVSLQVAAQVTVEPKGGKTGKATDTFLVKAGAAQPLEVSFQWVGNYPAEKMKKACQDPLFRGLQVQGAWNQATLIPGSDAVVAVYDRTLKLEREGLPAFPLASVQGPGWSVTVLWITTMDVRVLQDCQMEESYDWWHIVMGGSEQTRQGLLLEVTTAAGREWWFLEKCRQEPTVARRLEGPGSLADLKCPPAK